MFRFPFAILHYVQKHGVEHACKKAVEFATDKSLTVSDAAKWIKELQAARIKLEAAVE